MDTTTHPYFIPADAAGSRKETAILLVGTADEFGIDQRDIRMIGSGFRVSQAMADALDLDTDEDDETEDEDLTPGQDTPESDPENPDHDSLGEEVPDPDAEGDETRLTVAADPDNPVEAETPVYVEENGEPKIAPANAPAPDYSGLEYNDLKAEVLRREIDVPNFKRATLIDALTAADTTSPDTNSSTDTEE